MTSTTIVKAHPRRKSEAAQKQASRQHAMTALLRREIELDRAMRELNRYRDDAGWKQDRTTSQSAMFDGIPPITAFMGMEG